MNASVKPARLQLSRKKGFNLQAHSRAVNGLPAVVVARPTMWGNPFTVINTGLAEEHQSAVDRFRKLFRHAPSRRRHMALTILKGNAGRGEAAVARMRENLPRLRGHNLACWCSASCPCHADVLLELANGPVCTAVSSPAAEGERA